MAGQLCCREDQLRIDDEEYVKEFDNITVLLQQVLSQLNQRVRIST
jgi:hypothetical protein